MKTKKQIEMGTEMKRSVIGIPKVEAKNIRFFIGDIEYRWEGGFGCIISSYENKIKKGDVRVIGDTAFYAYFIECNGIFRKNKVWWSVPSSKIDCQWLREFKASL